MCITFELLSINLYEFIKNNNFQGVSLGLIRRFAIQLLAVEALDSNLKDNEIVRDKTVGTLEKKTGGWMDGIDVANSAENTLWVVPEFEICPS